MGTSTLFNFKDLPKNWRHIEDFSIIIWWFTLIQFIKSWIEWMESNIKRHDGFTNPYFKAISQLN